MTKGLYIKTYGCQMNVYDSQKISGLLCGESGEGYTLVDDASDAHTIVINTCHIREKAAEKLYSELGRMRARGCKATIVVAGCVAQAEGDELYRRAPNVDVIVGPQSIHTLPDLLKNFERGTLRQQGLDFRTDKFDFLPGERGEVGVSSFLSIQEGCDKFCGFCCVPYTRGAEYSRPVADIIAEAQQLVSLGAREITLLGQNVNAYRGWDGDQITNLGLLLERLSSIEGLRRLRYTSSHPLDMHDELYAAHAANPKVMPFLHLPVQSGSTRVLKAMNRKHTADYYLAVIERMRREVQGVQFSSDFIVGYPGETEEDFAATLALVRQVRYAQAYSFKYSPRPGTPAASKEETEGVPEEVKSQRLQVLQDMLNEQQREFNDAALGREVSVLIERVGDGQLTGRTPHMQLVHFTGEGAVGEEVVVRVVRTMGHSLMGSAMGDVCA
jgi:tRNA-2-methylthio-N6-dimethylallyladenosine synthase